MKGKDFDWQTNEFMLYCRTTQLREKKHTSNNGKKWRSYKQDAEANVINYGPYGSWGGSLGNKMVEHKYESVHQVTVDQITFGRVIGTITFIREEFDSEIKKDENGISRLLVLHNGEEVHSGTWREGMEF